jgi:hypothetical protein
LIITCGLGPQELLVLLSLELLMREVSRSPRTRMLKTSRSLEVEYLRLVVVSWCFLL